jgi:FdhD protein/molybdopterin-guanine dinucleotide biosynthesis protein A
MPTPKCLAGIFIGGQSKRMLGTPKGLLHPPGSAQNLVERLVGNLVAAELPNIVLVGDNEAYYRLGIPVVPDPLLGRGPIAGLLGLAEYAANSQFEFVLVVACDMPGVDSALLRRLRGEFPMADALVPKREHWEPLCARYRVRAILPCLQRLVQQGQGRMTSLLELLGEACVRLPIDASKAGLLEDWDAPSDLPEGVSYLGKPFRQGER